MKQRRRFWWIMARAIVLFAAPGLPSHAQPPDPASLRVVGGDFPRAFFFRQAEGFAAQGRMPFEQWERTFGRLMGVMGKVLDEEVPGRSRGRDTFIRFKRSHPDQAVLLHVNGNARDPRYEGVRFFAGHWLYYNGATVPDAIAATAGETTLRVGGPRLFEVNGGRYRNANDDIGLCELGPGGRPDWSRSEQVQLLAVDLKARTIRVRRGAYGTVPRAFPAGRGYAAAHCTEGPWGGESHLLWHYNYATTGPRDGQGRTCADVWVQHLKELFTGDGPLACFDGLEFDVMFNQPNGSRRPVRGPDCDADGRRDNGVIGGVNVYGNGVVAFCRELRAALGDGKLILADGAFRRDNQQRATASLNGIESEGWPVLGDFKIDDWSGGLNRHEYWRQNGRPPAFNYVNVKFVETGGRPGETKQAAVPLGSVRLAFAGAVFTDSAITFSHRPAGGAADIWDELVAGKNAQAGWLGAAIAPARHLADGEPDMFAGPPPWGAAALTSKLMSEDAELTRDGDAVRVSAKRAGAGDFSVRLTGVHPKGGDLCVTVVVRSAPMDGMAPEMARLMYASVFPAGGAKAAGPEIMSWAGPREFTSRFYFRSAPARADVTLRFESAAPVWISSVQLRAAPDLVIREFARGLVLANPSDTPRTFDLAAITSGRTWRRLRGTPGQDPRTNNGERVGAALTLPARDALFLIADPPAK